LIQLDPAQRLWDVLASGTITRSGPAADLAEQGELERVERAYLGEAQTAQKRA
jgi:hypothetical protein